MQSLIVRHIKHGECIPSEEENSFHPAITRMFKQNSYTVMLTGKTKLQVWTLKSDDKMSKSCPQGGYYLAPPIVFDGRHPSINIREHKSEDDKDDLDAKFYQNCHASLQSMFEIHCSDSFNYLQDEYAFKTRLITVFSVVMAKNMHRTHTELKPLNGFDSSFEHLDQMFSTEDINTLQNVFAEGYEFCDKFIQEHNISKNMPAEATRLISLSGACIVSQLAQDTSYSTHTVMDSLLTPASLRKNFFTAFQEILEFAKKSKHKCIDLIANALLLGERVIQDFLDISLFVEEQTTCAMCSNTIQCIDIVVGDCTTCTNCKRMLCNKCTTCSCPCFTTKGCLQGLFKQWTICQEATSKSVKLTEELLRTKKQNETLCRKNIEGLKKTEESEKKLSMTKYTVDSLTAEKKELKTELKKMTKEVKQLNDNKINAENALAAEKKKEHDHKSISAVQLEIFRRSLNDVDMDKICMYKRQQKTDQDLDQLHYQLHVEQDKCNKVCTELCMAQQQLAEKEAEIALVCCLIFGVNF